MTRSKTRIGGLLAFICVLALLVAGATPAFAHHKDGHEQGGSQQSGDHDGDADSDPSSTQTEDDSDPRESDPEGQADEGDNQHPSGKDRSVENGKSKSNPNQGKAESNPDDSKGPQRFEGGRGDDKPNGPGGEDAADQDGNNGCGNDDDFDDDNNGWCGKPRTSNPPPPPPPTDVQGSAVMSIQVDCFSVTVTSSKDISNVKVTFVDGTMIEINVNSPSFSQTFSKQIDFASAKSSTTTVVDLAPENCGQVSGSFCPTNPSLPMGHKDCGTVGGSQTDVCPAGTENAGREMDDLADCNKDDVEGRTDQANPVKVCPAGPFKGMPFMDADDCDFDRVSPSRIVRGAVAGAVAAAGDAAVRAVQAAGAALPFTGAGDLMLIAGLAVLLIAGGTFALRTRGTK